MTLRAAMQAYLSSAGAPDAAALLIDAVPEVEDETDASVLRRYAELASATDLDTARLIALRRVVELTPEHALLGPEAREDLALALSESTDDMHLGDIAEEAIPLLRQALATRTARGDEPPELLFSRRELIAHLVRRGTREGVPTDLDDAEEILRTMLRHHADGTTLVAEALVTLANCLLQQVVLGAQHGLLDEAETLIARALDILDGQPRNYICAIHTELAWETLANIESLRT